ncbi:MAG TPA: LptF/LptG family permease [Alphaproteobacteria bacterium]|nr:LptF/LptG family permease [Alphaproteobacteria bacterium]
MNRLGFYLFRQLLIAFVFASVAVTFVVLFTQSFRLLSIVIENASTTWMFLYLMALTIPALLPLILPISLGVAVIFIYNKLAIDSELVVMRAAGISPMRQALPALALTGMVVIGCYALTLSLAPAANRGLVGIEYALRDNYSIFLARPGNFNDITNGLTFYARARGPHGSLQGILMHDVRKPERPVTIMADSGQIVDKNGRHELVVFNGRRQEMDTKTGQLSQIAFDQYVLDLDSLRGPPADRIPDPREETLGQLLYPSPRILAARTHGQLMAELHQRLASPLLALSYALIGLATILAGEFNRRGMSRRILVATATIVTLQAIAMSMNSLIAGSPWLAFALYLLVLVPVPVCLALLNAERVRSLLPHTTRLAEPAAP